MKTAKVRVAPYIAADGAINSLAGLADRDKIKISGAKPPSISANATVKQSKSEIFADEVASLGFGDLLDININADTRYILIDLHIDEIGIPGAQGGVVVTEYYGVSVRVCVKAWNFNGAISTRIGDIAAKATANTAAVAYQVDVIGIQASDLTSLPGLISGSIGTFDMTKMQAVGAVFSELSEFIATNPEQCQPELSVVSLDFSALRLPFQRSTTSIYCLGRIAAGLSFVDAMANPPAPPQGVPPIDAQAAERLYQAWVGSLEFPPNATQRQRARDALPFGSSK